MAGFADNYMKTATNDPRAVMHGFSPEQVPVLSTLAKSFGVSDRWHASAPNQTWPNRFFVHTGTASGYVNNSPSHFPYMMPTIFNRLTENQRSWRIYHHDFPQTATLARIWSELPDHLYSFEDDFMSDAMSGRLPNYSFIEPRFFSSLILNRMPNDQHPPHNVAFGERLIARCYDALRNGAGWAQTLFIVTYDEHGGIYDHVCPPAAVPPDDLASDGFTFDRFGVRVPAVIVSPWVPAGKIVRPPAESRYPFDHTSILSTLRELFKLGEPLTKRDAVAPHLIDSLSLPAPSNNGPQSLSLPTISPSMDELMAAHQAPANSLQQSLAELSDHLPAGNANVPLHTYQLSRKTVPPAGMPTQTVADALSRAQAGLDRFLSSPRATL
jgi:phospholipase C